MSSSPQRHPVPTQPRRRPLPGLTISTERRLPTENDPASCNAAVSHYVTHHREKRLRKGDVYLRRCVTVFFVSFAVVCKSPQYSHPYYLGWIVVYLSFFLMLPTVLPTDNARIAVMLLFSAVNIGSASAYCLKRAVMKRAQYVSGECAATALTPWLCAWNVCFWACHGLMASGQFALFAHSAVRASPAVALHRFWRGCGIYFICVSLNTSIDLALSYAAGKYSMPHFVVAGRYNWALAFEQCLIGCLCCSNRFKNAMWRFSAQAADIRPLSSYASTFATTTTKRRETSATEADPPLRDARRSFASQLRRWFLVGAPPLAADRRKKLTASSQRQTTGVVATKAATASCAGSSSEERETAGDLIHAPTTNDDDDPSDLLKPARAALATSSSTESILTTTALASTAGKSRSPSPTKRHRHKTHNNNNNNGGLKSPPSGGRRSPPLFTTRSGSGSPSSRQGGSSHHHHHHHHFRSSSRQKPAGSSSSSSSASSSDSLF